MLTGCCGALRAGFYLRSKRLTEALSVLTGCCDALRAGFDS